MKRIAIIYRNIAGLSGTPNTIIDHAAFLSGMGFRVDLIAERFDCNRITLPPENLVKVRRLPFFKRWRSSWFARQADKKARRDYDFVAGHGHNFYQDVLSLHNCAHQAHEKMHKQPLINPDTTALIQDKVLRQQTFKFCIANSKLMRSDLIRRYSVPGEKIKVIYPGYHTGRFDDAHRNSLREPVRRDLGISGDHLLVGLITSGDFRKRGVDLAIAAFAGLSAGLRKRSSLVVVGKTSSLEKYQKLAIEHGVDANIRFLPVRPDIEVYYHALDLYVHPARFEEFGQSVQEAMACGLPVVASRQVGAMELLPEEAYAEVPDELDADSLSRQLERFLTEPSLRQRWSDYGLAAAEKNSAEINFQKTLEVYKAAGL
ncbi:MAG TPA: glycosyltransferase family 4 protein [Gammaproteobacteria bacterium]